MTEDKKEDSIASMIAKVELSAEIAQIALSCSHCVGPVQDAINRFKNRKIGLGQNQNNNGHQEGGSPFAAVTKDGISTEVSTNVSNTRQYK